MSVFLDQSPVLPQRSNFMQDMKQHKTTSNLNVAARPAFSNEAVNPYNSLLYRAISNADRIAVHEHQYTMLPWRYDILHMHWPEFDVLPRSLGMFDMLKKLSVWSWLLLARASGTKIVWTAHNLFGHDTPPSRLNMFLWKRFISIVDGVIFLSESSRSAVLEAYPELMKCPSTMVRHGHYGPWIDKIRGAASAPNSQIRRALEAIENKFVLLHFGQMRAYKNVDELMRQFSMLEAPDIRLLIAGNVPDRNYQLKLEALAAVDSRILLLPGHLDDASLVACLDRADLVVLPYRKILNSGSALLALSAGKHVVVPAIGSMSELQCDTGLNALTLFDGPFNADVLRHAIKKIQSDYAAPPNLEQYDWTSLGSRTACFYRDLLERS